MTIAEIERAIASKIRVKKIEAQERASYDYMLADLMARSMARIYSSTAKYPAINEVYTTIFDSAEIIEKKRQQKVEVSTLRFKQFANSFNKRFKEVQENE